MMNEILGFLKYAYIYTHTLLKDFLLYHLTYLSMYVCRRTYKFYSLSKFQFENTYH